MPLQFDLIPARVKGCMFESDGWGISMEHVSENRLLPIRVKVQGRMFSDHPLKRPPPPSVRTRTIKAAERPAS
jgi:hypothetical protein